MHNHGAGLDHQHHEGPLGWIGRVFHLHGHEHGHNDGVWDHARSTQEGIRTVWIALGALALTALLQVVIFTLSGSVALLADTVHNFGDMLNSVPLLLAFYLARRPPTRRYTYGYGRAEDVAGIIIVVSILFSAGYILWESFSKLLNPQPLTQLPWVAAAAVIGFIGNELVAVYQISVGRRIGSASLVADGQHARIDGLTSLIVLVAVAGSALGFPIVDPLVGLVIGVAILFIARDATRQVWYRLMDAVEPAIIDQIAQYAGEIADVTRVQARYVGHELHAELALRLPDNPTMEASQEAIDQIRRLLHQYVKHLGQVTIEIENGASDMRVVGSATDNVVSILPLRYQDPSRKVSAAPMKAVELAFDDRGDVAWDEMWEGFCELAIAGGAPHRGTLLEPVHEAEIMANPEKQEWVLNEIERGLHQVTGLEVKRSSVPGWIGLTCSDEEMAIWMLRAIVVENVTVRREDNILWFPAGPGFRLDKEIRNVITVAAKTNHYWQEHLAGEQASS
ncbi:MAG: cation diffusion facilitator family transporter [Thermomicrobiales bacterium]|nr:cation diffusion facilitator family transporter [Thermomicrobiales bacterium]MCO5219153.1 cation diffusion facilitator family transporter [Thermomicrobiales bacterium]MCO5226291.1 cation diffusion facilitator family transporter [Thermomicrobiales bacterium]MCO5228973.1 cation diffusion facilitator family transporter [Thermomicrobiales bacterium]